MQENREFIKKALILAFPVMIQQLLNNLLNMTDTVMIGMIGEDAISGVAVANKVFFIYQLILFGLSNGFGIFISQFGGSKRRDKLTDIFNEGIRACLLVAVLGLAVCGGFQDLILSLYLKNAEVFVLAKQYLSVLLVSFIPFAMTNMYSVCFRSLELPGCTLTAGTVSFMCNIIGNYVLIFGKLGLPAMGVTGAAVSTVVSRFIELAVLCGLGRRHLSDVRLRFRVSLERGFRGMILKRALPLMTNELIWSIGLNVIFISYSFAGESFIPAVTVVDSISNLVYVVFSGCSVAISAIIGKTLGSGDMERAKREVRAIMKLVMAIYLAGGAILIVTSTMTPRLFSLSEQNLYMATRLLIIKALFAWTQGYSNTVYYVLRAGGDTRSVLIIDGLFTWFGPVLFSIIGARLLHLGIDLTYLLVEGAGLLKVCLATRFLKKENWIKNLTLQEG
ncbi:MAG: MATE family efflux transporter [Lachnospiraceae bacterium]|nr:MATE family efflux transporter [Lachnospiraceae bacterium]